MTSSETPRSARTSTSPRRYTFHTSWSWRSAPTATWLESPETREPGRPRRAAVRGLAAQADDDPLPLVEVAVQQLDVLAVADAGLHLDAAERAVRREDVDDV